jgi:hypothetical protein
LKAPSHAACDPQAGSNWRPNANASFGWFFVFVSWAGTALGWTLATLIVAGYTGLARRVDNP